MPSANGSARSACRRSDLKPTSSSPRRQRSRMSARSRRDPPPRRSVPAGARRALQARPPRRLPRRTPARSGRSRRPRRRVGATCPSAACPRCASRSQTPHSKESSSASVSTRVRASVTSAEGVAVSSPRAWCTRAPWNLTRMRARRIRARRPSRARQPEHDRSCSCSRGTLPLSTATSDEFVPALRRGP